MPDPLPAIPLAHPDLGAEEEAEVLDVLRSGRLALGPKTLEFERLLAAFTASTWAAAVSSGTAGLHLAVRALGIGNDDCVITTSFSFIASANWASGFWKAIIRSCPSCWEKHPWPWR